MAFGDSFTFSRPTAAPYVDAAGVTRTAAVDQPRFDHSGRGRPIGLLVEGGDNLGQGDRTRVIAGDWSTLAQATILHEWSPVAGTILAEAHYAADPAAMIDGCLGASGHHRRIAVIAGFLQNYGGWVWALGQRWDLPRPIASRGAAVIGTGGGKLLIGS